MKIYATAPSRIGLFGGGTDIPVYYQKFGGATLSMAINIRQHITIDFNGGETSWGELPENSNKGFYQAFFDDYKAKPSFVNAKYDTVIESGLGSSASAGVCLTGALNRFFNRKMNRSSMAERAWRIETQKLKLYGGKQDQYASVYGGVNFIRYTNKKVSVKSVDRAIGRDITEELADHMVLVHLGQNRTEKKIQEQLKRLTGEQIGALNQIKTICEQSLKAIVEGDYEKMGMFMALSWYEKKRANSKATNDSIDRLYHYGVKCGAIGGKLCGAGGGGHMLFVVPDGRKREISQKISKRYSVLDFSPDYNGLEVRVI